MFVGAGAVGDALFGVSGTLASFACIGAAGTACIGSGGAEVAVVVRKSRRG